MATTDIAATRTRVAMVAPQRLSITVGVCDMRATDSDYGELVDQLHHHESATLLARRSGWAYVQADDHYFGWVHESAATPETARPGWRVVAVALADVHERPDAAAPVVDRLPAGTWLTPDARLDKKGWTWSRRGWVPSDATTAYGDLPHRPPTPDDLVATAEAFLGVPYLWGGTSALGLDCSGLVQQVYRLNGVRLDRDADQQAMEGRPVDVPVRGDLVFFGTQHVTHVGIARDERTMIDALGSAKKVQVDDIDGIGVGILAIRRYLP